MAVQHILDKDQPYGSIFGDSHNGARYTQNGIEFNTHGKRVSPLTPEEIVVEQVAKEAAEAAGRLSSAKAAAVQAAKNVSAKAAAEAAAKAGPPPKPDNMPDFTNYTKTDMISLAKNKYGVTMDPRKTWKGLRNQLEGLY